MLLFNTRMLWVKNTNQIKNKILIIFGDIIAAMLSNKKPNPIPNGLFIRDIKWNISLVFIM